MQEGSHTGLAMQFHDVVEKARSLQSQLVAKISTYPRLAELRHRNMICRLAGVGEPDIMGFSLEDTLYLSAYCQSSGRQR